LPVPELTNVRTSGRINPSPTKRLSNTDLTDYTDYTDLTNLTDSTDYTDYTNYADKKTRQIKSA